MRVTIKLVIRFFIILMLLQFFISFAFAEDTQKLEINENTYYNLDLDNDGQNDTAFGLKYQSNPFPSITLKAAGLDKTYERVFYNARPETLAITTLTEPGKNEIMFSWRAIGSGNYLGYILLGYTANGFGEMLEIEDLNHGNLTIKDHSLVQTSVICNYGSPNSSPIGIETVTRQWNDGMFSAETSVQNSGGTYQNLLDTSYLMPKETEQLINQKALEMNVPPVIVKAIAMVESGGRQYNNDGTIKTGSSGEIGIMQVYPDPQIFTQEEIERLKDINFNIETGIKILVTKKMYSGYVLPVFVESESTDYINMDDNTLESWYFALWAYNGWVKANNPGYVGVGNTYQDRVISYISRFGYEMNTPDIRSFSSEMPTAGQSFTLPGKHLGNLEATDSGKKAIVQNTDLNLREQPALFFGPNKVNVNVKKVMQPGQKIFTIEGPSTNNLSRWYRVRLDNSSTIGWAAGEYMHNSQKLLFTRYLAMEDTDLFDPKTTDNPLKEWLIQFNLPLDAGTVNSQNIIIYNHEGEPLDMEVVLQNKGKSVNVVPLQVYKPNDNYYLYISSNVSSQSTTLRKPVLMRFTLGQ